MFNMKSKPEAKPKPKSITISKVLANSWKRARLASITIDLDSDFLKQGFTIVRRCKSRASQLGRTIQDTQDIRNILVLATQSSFHE